MKSIYIILTQSGTEISKLIKLFTKEPYNHSSICIDESFNEFYSFGRKKANYVLPGGFIIENAFKHVFAKYEKVPCLILKKDVTDEQYENLKNNINHFIENNNSFSYAIIGLLLANTNFTFVNKSKFFCSQFVAKLLNDISIETPKIPAHMHPMDFTKIANVQIIYEGELKDFCNTINKENCKILNKVLV